MMPLLYCKQPEMALDLSHHWSSPAYLANNNPEEKENPISGSPSWLITHV